MDLNGLNAAAGTLLHQHPRRGSVHHCRGRSLSSGVGSSGDESADQVWTRDTINCGCFIAYTGLCLPSSWGCLTCPRHAATRCCALPLIIGRQSRSSVPLTSIMFCARRSICPAPHHRTRCRFHRARLSISIRFLRYFFCH